VLYASNNLEVVTIPFPLYSVCGNHCIFFTQYLLIPIFDDDVVELLHNKEFTLFFGYYISSKFCTIIAIWDVIQKQHAVKMVFPPKLIVQQFQ